MLTYLGSALASQSVAERPYKTCSCGAEYSRLRWLNLPLAGLQVVPADDEPAVTLECRHCRCGSTLAVEVKP